MTHIRLNSIAFCATLDDLTREIERVSSFPLGQQAVERAFDVLKCLRWTVRARHRDDCAADAADLLYELKVPDRLLDLVAALGAWDGQGHFVFEGHGSDGTEGSESDREERAFTPGRAS